jgi:hypothetical protein
MLSQEKCTGPLIGLLILENSMIPHRECLIANNIKTIFSRMTSAGFEPAPMKTAA